MDVHAARVVVGGHVARGTVVMLVDDVLALLPRYAAAGLTSSGVEEFGDGSRVARFGARPYGVVLVDGGPESFAYRAQALTEPTDAP